MVGWAGGGVATTVDVTVGGIGAGVQGAGIITVAGCPAVTESLCARTTIHPTTPITRATTAPIDRNTAA